METAELVAQWTVTVVFMAVGIAALLLWLCAAWLVVWSRFVLWLISRSGADEPELEDRYFQYLDDINGPRLERRMEASRRRRIRYDLWQMRKRIRDLT